MTAFEKKKTIKRLIKQVKLFINQVDNTLADTTTISSQKYVSYAIYAGEYNQLAKEGAHLLNLSPNPITVYDVSKMGSYMDTLWGFQKQVMESVSVNARFLLSYLESEDEFVEDEYENLTDFLKSRLRTGVFQKPEKEVEIQNAVEMLLIGQGKTKGIDYDRETGKFEFSGKEYIPDFILPKLNLCVEIKLLKEGRKSAIIDQINADIVAYSSKYERILFVVYDLGVIRDEVEFRRDIENVGENIKVLVIKH